MSSSRHEVDYCIVFDGLAAHWVTPSQAVRMMEADPRVELIEELHPYFEDYAKLAGLKPRHFIEDPDAQAGEGGNDTGVNLS